MTNKNIAISIKYMINMLIEYTVNSLHWIILGIPIYKITHLHLISIWWLVSLLHLPPFRDNNLDRK